MEQLRKGWRVSGVVSAVAFALAAMGSVQAKEVTDADILNDAENTSQVVTHGLGTKGQRYSPLAQINDRNVEPDNCGQEASVRCNYRLSLLQRLRASTSFVY